MKNSFHIKLLLCALLLSVYCCKPKVKDSTYQITVKNNTGSNIKAELQLIVGNNIKKLDSVSVLSNQAFEFKGPLVEASFFRIEINDAYSAIVAVDNAALNVAVNSEGDNLTFATDGGSLQKDFETIRALQSKYESQKDSLNKAYILAENTRNFILIENLEKSYELYYRQFESAIKSAIVSNNKSIVSVYACSLLEPRENMAFFDTLTTQFSAEEGENSIIKDFISAIKKQTNTKLGSVAPNFTGNSPDGRKVSLADFKGKVVLLDFWASWCIPCRKANPEVVKLYQSLKGKNFEIIGISLDNQADKWKAAIADDKLTWPHISDLGGWDSEFAALYNIEEIPQTFLLDTKGVIVAKNLRGQELEAKIEDLLQASVN